MHLLELACSDEPDYALACFTLIGLHTGLRKSEILKLQRTRDRPGFGAAVDHRAGRERQVGSRPGGWRVGAAAVIPANRLKRLPERSPSRSCPGDERFAKLVQRAGIKRKVTPHMLRHTAAMCCCAPTGPRGAGWLGHRSMATTQQYCRAHQNDVLDAATVWTRPILALD